MRDNRLSLLSFPAASRGEAKLAVPLLIREDCSAASARKEITGNWLSQGSLLIPEDAQKLELSGPGSTPCRDKLEGTRSQTGPCLFTRSELPAQTSPSASHVPKQAVKSRLRAAGSSS